MIELKDIGFCYREATDRKILRHLNAAFEEGKTTAVVGGSGAGKTTLFKLLCGFEQVTQGSYELFGVNFREWNLKAARKRIALVSQNVFLFPDTIAANVAYGSESATLEEIQQACKMANIHEYIMTLPEQYETIVGERGANLSGGEKQRISMARAFLKKAPILLMDEPTSALDTKTEAAIQRALEGIAQNTTVIMIAHRLSTIQNADHILVLDQGTLAESGTHQELLKQDGVYASLYKRERHTEDLAVEC